MQSERRKSIRYIPQENAFAALGRRYKKVGHIKDISRGGLAFEFIAGEKNIVDGNQIDVFLTGNGFHLYNVGCRVIYEQAVRIPKVNSKYVKMLTLKKCGVSFSKMSKQDNSQLEYFLEHHTVGVNQ